MVNTIKFSQFAIAPLTSGANEVVGLESGVNVQSVRFLTWTTLGRPATPFNGLIGLNTTLQQYEFWDASISQWTQLEDSGDINDILARLASHSIGEGASLIGLQNQSNVTSKTVQDLANATFIAQTSNGTLQNAQYLGSLTTGIVKNTTTTGVLSISVPVTSIDNLTTVANNLIYTTSPNVYAVIAPGNSSTLISSAGGTPSWSQTLPTSVQSNITQLGAQSQALNMNSHLINNVTNPVSAQDAATKAYVDETSLNGTSVYAASAASLGTVTQSGAGVGATLTNAGAQATFALDGVNPPIGINVLIKNTATGMTAANEGIYTVTNPGSGATNWVLTRATSYDTPAEINNTGLIIVQNGSTLAGTAWYNSTTIVTVDTTAFTYSQFGASFPLTVPQGGTSVTSFTAYAVITGGTTSTGALQSIASVGTSGQVLTSNGAGALPTFQTASGGSVTSVGTAGLATGGPITTTGTVTVTASSQSDQQTGTSSTTAVTPSVFTYHLGSAKAWGIIGVGVGPTLLRSLNISGVVRNGAGDYTVSFVNQYAFSNGFSVNVTPTNSAAALSGNAGTINSASAQLLVWSIGAAPAKTDTGYVYLSFTVHGSNA